MQHPHADRGNAPRPEYTPPSETSCESAVDRPILSNGETFVDFAGRNQPVFMPRRELSKPQQIIDWLEEWGAVLVEPATMTLIGSAALLWHAADRGLDTTLPENSMDVDPVTDSDALAWMCYDALIGSEFEQRHGWHVNLLPASVLREFPSDWEQRAKQRTYGRLTVIVPSPSDLLVPKLKRNEPRDRMHAEWARQVELV
jgi:hypothetical protein